MSYIPSMSTFIYAFLSFAIPWTMYRVNQYMHKHGDPPWKQDDEGTS